VATKDIDMVSYDEFWNGEYMKNVRKKFLAGEKLAECGNCFGDANKEEDERYYKTFDKLYGDMVENIIKNTNHETGETTISPVYLDYRNSLCNLKCKTCYSGSSSSISTASNISTGKTIFPIIDYKKTFNSQWDDFQKIISEKTQRIYWAGGEPLMNPMYWRTMDYIIENGWTHIGMFYNTNITKLVDDKLFERAMKYFTIFEETHINVSIDGIGEVNDYVRAGSKWDEVDNVLRKLIDRLGPHRISVDVTITNLALLQLVEILKYAADIGVGVMTKAMMESKGWLAGGQYHDSNVFLSANYLTLETFNQIKLDAKEYLTDNPVKTNILDLLDFMSENFKNVELDDDTIKRITDHESRHGDTWSIVDVIKQQSLTPIKRIYG